MNNFIQPVCRILKKIWKNTFIWIMLLLSEYNTLNGGIDMLLETDRFISFFPSLAEPSCCGKYVSFFFDSLDYWG